MQRSAGAQACRNGERVQPKVLQVSERGEARPGWRGLPENVSLWQQRVKHRVNAAANNLGIYTTRSIHAYYTRLFDVCSIVCDRYYMEQVLPNTYICWTSPRNCVRLSTTLKVAYNNDIGATRTDDTCHAYTYVIYGLIYGCECHARGLGKRFLLFLFYLYPPGRSECAARSI